MSISTELRELEYQLKAAYMNKERMAQIAEKQAEKSDVWAHDVEQERIVAEQRKQAEEAMKQREEERMAANKRYQEALQLQLQVKNSLFHLFYRLHNYCIIHVLIIIVVALN